MNKNEKFWAYFSLISVSFFWGTTYFGIRIAVVDIPPFLLVGSRHLLAGFILCFYFMVIKKEKLPLFCELKKMFITAALLIMCSNVMVSFAEKSIPSGLTALLCSFLPFYILLINQISGIKNKLNTTSISGLVLGLVGMIVIFYDSLIEIVNGEYLFGIILVLSANFTWAFGLIYSKNANIKASPLYSSGLQMFMIGCFITIFSGLIGDFQKVVFTASGILSFFYLVIFGSIVGFGSFTYANTKLPPNISSIYAYINPIVAIILGTFFLNETISAYTVLGIFLTLFGVFFINSGYRKSVA